MGFGKKIEQEKQIIMNILQFVPNKGWGGGEKCVYELSCALRERGHGVEVVMPKCDTLKKRFSIFAPSVFGIKFFLSPSAILKIRDIIKNRDIDVVHTHIFKHAMCVLVAKRLFGLDCKVIMTRHICRRAKKSMRYNWLYKHIDKLVFVSNFAKNYFLGSSPQVSSTKIEVIHNAVNFVHYDDDNEPHKPGEVIRFGFAGRLSPEKGVKEMIKAFGECKTSGTKFEVLIAGSGPQSYVKELERLIEGYNLGDSIQLLGFIDELHGFYKKVDVMVVPTIAKEAFGLTVLEAMKEGKAIITSSGAQNELLDETKDAVFIEPKDTSDFARAINIFLTNKNKVAHYGAMAKKAYEGKYDFDRYVSKYINIYQ